MAGQVPASHNVPLALGNDAWVAMGYQLGVVELLPAAQEATVTRHPGPDLLGPDWDPDEAARRLGAVPSRAIGEALLDQRNLAGIGNLYKSEVLFLRGSTHGARSARSTISGGWCRWRSDSSMRTRTGSARSPRACDGAARRAGARQGRLALPSLPYARAKGRAGQRRGRACHISAARNASASRSGLLGLRSLVTVA